MPNKEACQSLTTLNKYKLMVVLEQKPFKLVEHLLFFLEINIFYTPYLGKGNFCDHTIQPRWVGLTQEKKWRFEYKTLSLDCA